MGYYPIPRLGHNTTDYIVTLQDTGRSMRATIRQGNAHDTVTTLPRHGRQSVTTCGSAHARGLAGRVMSRYNKLYCDRKAAWPLRYVMIQTIVLLQEGQTWFREVGACVEYNFVS